MDTLTKAIINEIKARMHEPDFAFQFTVIQAASFLLKLNRLQNQIQAFTYHHREE